MGVVVQVVPTLVVAEVLYFRETAYTAGLPRREEWAFMIPRRNLLTFALSLLTLVMAISVTAAVPISASSELTRPVTVANGDTSPVPTRNVDEPGRTEVSLTCNTILADGANASPFEDARVGGAVYTVPSGKRLIVETVSLVINKTGGTGVPVYAQLLFDGQLLMGASDQGLSGGTHYWVGNQQVRVAASAGAVPGCRLYGGSNVGSSMALDMYISGYLVPST